MRERLRGILKKAREIPELAKNEKRDMTDDERAEFNSLCNDADSLSADIIQEERLQNLEETGRERSSTATRSEPNDQQRLDRPAGDFRSFGEMLQAVARADSGHGVHPSLRMEDRENFETRAPSGMSAGVGSDGGYLLRPEYSNEILNLSIETGQIASRCRQIPVSARVLIMNAVKTTSRATGSRWGGVRAYWEGEGATTSDSKAGFREFRIDLRKLTGLAYATEELLADAPALGNVISQALTEEFGFMLDDSILRGGGTNSPKGILGSQAVVTVAKETDQDAATIVFQNLSKMWARCWGRARQNAAWFINQEIEPQLDIMAIPVGTGGIPVMMPAGGLSGAPFPTIKNRPVIPIEQASALGTKGDIILAAFSEYILARRGGIDMQESIHVRFVQGEMTFRFRLFVGGDTPWDAALTPYKGNDTLSPFVVLADRS